MNFNLDKEFKYVVACSFGPDSMALLDMLQKEGYQIVVAHVNYHKRNESNSEEKALRKYCFDHFVPCEVLDTTGMACDKNFQEWAREVRYKFFKKVVDMYDAKAVLVAHHQDDLLETFLMQEQRGGIVKYWGIAEKTNIFNVEVIRPLLEFKKSDLLKYNEENNVPYSIDVSNLYDDYERNRIRHTIVEKLTNQERANLLLRIKEKNIVSTFETNHIISPDKFLSFSDAGLVYFISNNLSEHIDLSFAFLNEIRKAFNSKKNYIRIRLSGNVSLIKDYNLVYFSNQKICEPYSYLINQGDCINDDLFEIDLSLYEHERNIELDDYPLTIKPVSRFDSIKISNYECEVRRLFIDWKVPHLFRDYWPGIYNKDGKLIYIPRYREKFVDNHISKFIIKFTKLDQN